MTLAVTETPGFGIAANRSNYKAINNAASDVIARALRFARFVARVYAHARAYVYVFVDGKARGDAPESGNGNEGGSCAKTTRTCRRETSD